MEPNTQTKKPWYKRWWVIVLGVLIVIGVINQIVNPGSRQEAAETPAATAEPVVETAEPAPTEEPVEEVTPDLAARVTEALYDGNARCDGNPERLTSFQQLCPTSPGFWIASIEDEKPGAVRVTFQERLDADEREQFARWVMQLSCLNVDDLDLVIAVDLDGYEQHWPRSKSAQVCN